MAEKAVAKTDSYPIPRIEDCIDKICSAKYGGDVMIISCLCVTSYRSTGCVVSFAKLERHQGSERKDIEESSKRENGVNVLADVALSRKLWSTSEASGMKRSMSFSQVIDTTVLSRSLAFMQPSAVHAFSMVFSLASLSTAANSLDSCLVRASSINPQRPSSSVRTAENSNVDAQISANQDRTLTCHRGEPQFITLRTISVIVRNGTKTMRVNALLDEASTRTYTNADPDVAAEWGIHCKLQRITIGVLNDKIESFETMPV
uniref:Peptidase aspartic putative domain-containing protein n=1 Tax=Magallana gigas TaxID=29159 RepID=A0A8W8JQB9_MAGGI